VVPRIPSFKLEFNATASRVVNHGFSLSKDNPGDVEEVKRIVEGMKERYGELLSEPISYFEDVDKLIGDLRTMITKAAEFHRKHPDVKFWFYVFSF